MTHARRYRSDSEYLGMMKRIVHAARDRLDNAELEQLADLVELRRELDDVIARTAFALASNGATWTEIGTATGTSKQAAHEKWGRRRIANSGDASAH